LRKSKDFLEEWRPLSVDGFEEEDGYLLRVLESC
jgi:hypothetical protein